MHKLRGQVLLLFILLQLVAMMLANGITALLSFDQVSQEITRDSDAPRVLSLELAKKTDLSAQEIASTVSTSSYRISVLESPDYTIFTDAQLALLGQGGSVTLGSWKDVRTYFILRDDLAMLQSHMFSALWGSNLLRGMLGNVMVMVIALLVMGVFSKRMVRPILRLTQATREVAAGNLDTKVPLDTVKGPFRLSDELTELTENFNRMTAELKGIEYLRRDFTSNVSHELKTPISAITGYAQILKCENVPDATRIEYAAAIESEARRLASLSDNLLRLTRLESQHIQPPTTTFALDEQLRQAIGMMLPEIESKSLQLSVALSPALIGGDEDLLWQVWLNLLGNAIKFSNQGGDIAVRLTCTQTHARVFIADSGIGMSEETQRRAFEKFFQADGSHHTGGNGLGLSLVRRIIDIHHGDISLTSTPGTGSTFCVTLPRP